MHLGYNTNGFAHHDLFDAVALLADIGYESVAITIDHTALSPNVQYNHQRTQRLRGVLEKRKMRSVIETGARFCSIRAKSTSRRSSAAIRPEDGKGSTSTSTPSTPPPNWAATAFPSGRDGSPRASGNRRGSHGSSTACGKSANMPRGNTSPSPSSPSRACSSIRWPRGKDCWPKRAWTTSA